MIFVLLCSNSKINLDRFSAFFDILRPHTCTRIISFRYYADFYLQLVNYSIDFALIYINEHIFIHDYFQHPYFSFCSKKYDTLNHLHMEHNYIRRINSKKLISIYEYILWPASFDYH